METAKVENKTKARAAQDFVPIEEIRDGVVILKTSGLRLVLISSSINFALKSEDEQTALLLQYQNFLNALEFHIQIFVESRKLDIRPYLTILEDLEKNQLNDLIKIQTREYVEFVRTFTENTNIMSKTFFVVIPYEPPVLEKPSGIFVKLGLSRRPASGGAAGAPDKFEEYRSQLEQRATVVAQGLSRLGLRVVQLGTEELVELFFKIFNPGEAEAPQLS
ncbi:MAG: hypothetical protein HYT47_01310 [Candidatus Vogelbacteria bacterium]|nr:hypothetical protein [Candidatus Vogelbacteria bacterium]